jgi:beta-lactam-binding protein with PASTA domain
MPIGPLIFFVIFAVIVALIFAFAFMPPNKLVEKVDPKKRKDADHS